MNGFSLPGSLTVRAMVLFASDPTNSDDALARRASYGFPGAHFLAALTAPLASLAFADVFNLF